MIVQVGEGASVGSLPSRVFFSFGIVFMPKVLESNMKFRDWS